MEDVADFSIKKARENLAKWEDLTNPIAPIESEGRETIIELMSISNSRSFGVNVHRFAVPVNLEHGKHDQKDSTFTKLQERLQSSSEVSY